MECVINTLKESVNTVDSRKYNVFTLNKNGILSIRGSSKIVADAISGTLDGTNTHAESFWHSDGYWLLYVDGTTTAVVEITSCYDVINIFADAKIPGKYMGSFSDDIVRIHTSGSDSDVTDKLDRYTKLTKFVALGAVLDLKRLVELWFGRRTDNVTIVANSYIDTTLYTDELTLEFTSNNAVIKLSGTTLASYNGSVWS